MENSVQKHADAELQKSGALNTARIQSLGDNIFGFAMTLLVLNFLVPELGHGNPLGEELLALGLNFLTYMMSFIVLGIMWVSQQNQYHFIERSDRFFLWINIFFLSCVVFVPFSTHVLALYYQSTLAVVLYGVNLLVCGALLYFHWSYATTNRRLVSEDLGERIVHLVKFRFLLIIAWVSVAVLISFVSIPVAFLLFVPGMILGMMPAVMDRLAHRWLS
ncbi:MAG: TMEM175 family protein [Patescibacteria group bacterium]